MQFHYGKVPARKVDVEPDSWKLIRGPKNMTILQLMAIPVGLAVTGAIGYLWLHIKPGVTLEVQHPVWLGGIVLGTPVIHEFVHAFSLPQFGMTRKTTMGIYPGCLIYGYVYYDGPMPRNRMLLASMMPFLLLSVFPLIVCSILEVFPLTAAFFSVANAAATCGDFILFSIMAHQVPSNAMIYNDGKNAYWSVDCK